ncbi:MAG TPA: FkbM family methyltransferase [Candidatus Eremiobacteraceae bacterium]|nr:FkbM family methyltransferase [Candidatus Eremiobacteraceae bacterium]
MFVSYAQNFEDVMLERVFGSQTNGFYIDVGAWHPETYSVTKHFYEKGWSGINIEPSKSYYEILTKRRSRDINLNVAIGTCVGSRDFIEVPESGLSSLGRDAIARAEQHDLSSRCYKIPVLTLQSVCEQYCCGKPLSFLKIDVEGCERDVIASLDWRIHRPVVVLVEAVHPDTGLPAWDTWECILLDAGYNFVWFDGLNRYYLKSECEDLKKHFLVPPGFADGFVLESSNPLCMKLGMKLALASRRILPPTVRKLLVRVYGLSKGMALRGA